MNKIKSGITGILAFLVSTALHAFLIGGIMYATGAFVTHKNTVKIDKKLALQRAYSLLPDVEVISDSSSLKRGENIKTQNAQKEDFGSLKPEVAAGGDRENSVFMYQDAVKRRIQEARNYPDDARKEGTQGAVEVAFEIQPDGSLGQVTLIKSSGRDVLDAEAVSTIKRASPFPAYAGTINNQKMDMQVAIVFKLN